MDVIVICSGAAGVAGCKFLAHAEVMPIQIIIISVAILTAIAHVEYVPAIFFLNVSMPVRITHMPNTAANPNVNKGYELANIVTIANATIDVMGRANIHDVMRLYVLLLLLFLWIVAGASGKKYPGIHVMAKPNGMLQIIFHAGMPIVRARRNLTYA